MRTHIKSAVFFGLILFFALSLYVSLPMFQGNPQMLPWVTIALVGIGAFVALVFVPSYVLLTAVASNPFTGLAMLTILLLVTHLVLPRIGLGVMWIGLHFAVIPLFSSILLIRFVTAGLREVQGVARLPLFLGALFPLAVLALTIVNPAWITSLISIK